MNEDIINVPLKVVPVGMTASSSVICQVYGSHDGAVRPRDVQSRGQNVVELAGRTCYAAYGRKNAETDSHEGYIGNMLKQNHLSVIEHASISFHISGISRAETHELIRHRHFSFSQESQRYVVVKKPYRVAIHPTLVEHYDTPAILEMLKSDFEMAETVYNGLKQEGLSRKEASEAARAFLPNAAATEIVVTGNLRSWLEFISKRDHPAADRGIRKLAKAIRYHLEDNFPEVFSEEARELWDWNHAQEAPKNESH